MDVLVLVLAFAVSLLPSIMLFFWLRGLQHDEAFVPLCNKALGRGALSVLAVILVSLAFVLLEQVLARVGLSGLARVAFHKFFVLACAEELVKMLALFGLMKAASRDLSWLDVIILMTIVGLGFGLAEDVPYAIGSGPIHMLVRGIDIGHGGYGFIMGYFLGKGMKTGRKVPFVVGFGLPWLLHGLYDFGLSDELLAISDDFAVVSVSLALVSVVTVFVLIRFMRRARNNPRYTEPLPARG